MGNQLNTSITSPSTTVEQRFEGRKSEDFSKPRKSFIESVNTNHRRIHSTENLAQSLRSNYFDKIRQTNQVERMSIQGGSKGNSPRPLSNSTSFVELDSPLNQSVIGNESHQSVRLTEFREDIVDNFSRISLLHSKSSKRMTKTKAILNRVNRNTLAFKSKINEEGDRVSDVISPQKTLVLSPFDNVENADSSVMGVGNKIISLTNKNNRNSRNLMDDQVSRITRITRLINNDNDNEDINEHDETINMIKQLDIKNEFKQKDFDKEIEFENNININNNNLNDNYNDYDLEHERSLIFTNKSAITSTGNNKPNEYVLNFYKSAEDLRRSYISKLISSKIWEPSKKPKSHNTLIIFDWDDTLLCTSFLTPNGIFDENLHLSDSDKEKLAKLEFSVLRLLTISIKTGDTYIITNAAPGWVEYSVERFYPSVKQLLSKLKIISARGEYETIFPGDSRQWKIEAFLKMQKTFNSNLVTNIICLGDSFIEMEAAHILASKFRQAFIKTVKFRESPKPEELNKQLSLVCEQFRVIYSSIKNLTIRVEKKVKK